LTIKNNVESLRVLSTRVVPEVAQLALAKIQRPLFLPSILSVLTFGRALGASALVATIMIRSRKMPAYA
jgi:hypothetical protein